MRSPTQFVFDLPVRPALGREDFFVAESNAAAVDWIDRWPDWPVRVAVLVGPAGCGKSHLARVWRAASGAKDLPVGGVASAAVRDLLGDATACVLDDAQQVAGMPAAEQALFHLFNVMAERGGFLLLTAPSPPPRWGIALPDLASRLATAQVLSLGPPDDLLMGALFAKLFADRQIRPGKGVIDYLVSHGERSHAAARDFVELVDRRTLGEGRSVRLPLVRKLLEEQEGAKD
jgi:chromosomal replication initiation ATPase DnaA